MQTHYGPVACCGTRLQTPSITVKSTIHVHAILTLVCACAGPLQGTEADEINPPSAETLSQSAKTDKTVLLSDMPLLSSTKEPKSRRA
jgi:hypothetical protein